MKKQELIESLIKNNVASLEELNGKKLSELKQLHSNIITIPQEVNSDSISDTDEGWSDWVMSHFTDNEKREDMPTCDGLRRVFRKIVGDIVSSQIQVIKAPTTIDQTATVMCTISYTKRGSSFVRSISDAVDVNQDNTPWPYNKSSVASACTKAEARALRKGLGLIRVYAAEEIQEGMNSDEINTTTVDANRPISDSAKIAINTMCNRLSVKPLKLFKFMGIEKEDVSHLSYSESHVVLAKLNAFTRGDANGGESIPEGLKSSEIIF